ncbi:MAG: hypothetical protein ACEQR8_00770 [Cypionkella sp.]
MTRRPASARRRWSRAGGRTAAAAVALAVVATFAIRDAAGQALRKADPELAYKLAPWDGRSAATLALQMVQSPAPAGGPDAALALARAGLRDDPTAVDAFNVLAMAAQLRGDTERTRALFRHSLALSRRELPSRVWAIEEAVSRGDIRGALNNYDFALKTSRDAGPLLFPILAEAISEPRIRAELLPILRQKPVWGAEFIDYLSRAAVNPEGTAAFHPELARAGLAVSPLQDARVVDALAARGLLEQAWRYYARIRPGADRRRSRDPDFRVASDAGAVFDWRTVSEGGRFGSLVRAADGGGTLAFSVAAASPGKLAEQRQMLPPGRYRLQGRAQGLDVPAEQRPFFALACDNGVELVQVPLPAAGRTELKAVFAVPPGCTAQTLALIARQSDLPGGLEGAIDTVQIAPID